MTRVVYLCCRAVAAWRRFPSEVTAAMTMFALTATTGVVFFRQVFLIALELTSRTSSIGIEGSVVALFSSLVALQWSVSEDSDHHRHPTR